jgi:hypothetical protein
VNTLPETLDGVERIRSPAESFGLRETSIIKQVTPHCHARDFHAYV